MKSSGRLLLAAIGFVALLPAMAIAEDNDPWEGFNRGIYRFNDVVDRYVAKPVAKTYQAVTPQPVDDAISRFLNNLMSPVTLVNELLQGKPAAAAATTSRFIFNSTLGVAGLFDIGAKMGMPRSKEDFGQTLAVWGVGQGPYLMLPLLGPSTVRDFFGRLADTSSDPRSYANSEVAYGILALNLVDTRADFLKIERLVVGDRYRFIREYYVQARDFDIADGVVTSDPFLDGDFEAGPTRK
jgi:phospholipid-binding lipoprotein MlaA